MTFGDSIHNNEHFQSILFEKAADAIFVSDLNGQIVQVNEQACRSTGYSEQELIQLKVFDIDSIYTTQEAVDKVIKSLASKQSVTIESSHRHKDGSNFPVEVNLTLVETSEESFVIGVARDISEWKKTEDALRQEKEFTDTALDVQDDTFFLFEPESGRAIRWNQAFRLISGYTDEEIAKLPAPESYYSPGDLKRANEFMKMVMQKGHGTIELELICKNGQKIPTEYRVSTICNEQGEAKYFISIGRDVTKRREIEDALFESEEHFRHLFENMNAGAAVYEAVDDGKDFIFSDLNAAGERLSVVKREDIIGKKVTTIFPAVKDIGLLDCLSHCYKTGEAQFLPLAKYDDGRILEWVENRVFRLPSGKVVAIYEDRTKQHRLEQRIQQKEKMEAIGHLAGGIAHDFNNILTPIIGFAEMALEEGTDNKRILKCLAKIHDAGERAKNLVKQILAFSRHSLEEKKPIHLYSVLEEVIELLRATLPTSIEIKSRLAEDSLAVLADATKIHEVVMNLCTNAAFAMNDKGVLEIIYEEKQIHKELQGRIDIIKTGFYAIITVKDTGCGIPEYVLKHIFEPFYTTKAVGEGTGMGLAVIYGIIQNHGGDITVKSKEGLGSSFQVFLPKVAEEISLKDEHDEECPTGNERIMFVDDEEVLNDLVSELLELLGYSVTVYSSSVEALEEFSKDPMAYDLIITDQTMPGLTGTELVEEMVRLREDIPILLCTGYSRMVDEEQALEMGIKGFCLKPFKKKDLAIKIRNILDERS